MAKKEIPEELFPLLGGPPDPLLADTNERPDDGLPPGRSEDRPPGMVVHNDHRIVINYNAPSRAIRVRALTATPPERDRTGTF